MEGRPSFALFADTVLKAAELAFGSDFEGQLAEMDGSPIRLVLTAQTPFFPQPLVRAERTFAPASFPRSCAVGLPQREQLAGGR